MRVQPNNYRALTQSAAQLLTSIYEHLHFHIDSNSPRAITSTSAFILTASSADYLKHVCEAVGYSTRPLATTRHGYRDRQSTGIFDDDLQLEDPVDDGEDLDEAYPCFFDSRLSQGITRARQSLKLLQTARPDHPLLIHSRERAKVRWFWSYEDVEAAWLGTVATDSELLPESTAVSRDETTAGSGADGGEVALRLLQLFDLEPGAHLQSNSVPSSSRPPNPFSDFQENFPSHLPPITPTLETLRDLVLL